MEQSLAMIDELVEQEQVASPVEDLVEQEQVASPVEDLVEQEQVASPVEDLVKQEQVASPAGEPTEEELVSSPMGELLENGYDYKHPQRGGIRQAVVLSIEPHQIVVDVRAKREGIVPQSDLMRLRKDELDSIKVGDEISVYVLSPQNNDGNVIVSVNMALVHQDWLRAEDLFESGEVYEGEVTNCNKGGVVVSFGRISGFVPASQLVNMPRRLSQERKMVKLAEYVGKTLPLKVIEVDRSRRRLIFSERVAQRKWREQQKQQLLNEIYEGEVRRGIVSSLCNFGAFVDLGGADGLVHISELAWHRVRHPSEVLSIGDEVDVYVLRLDHEKGRIGLSIKRLYPDPWTLAEDNYQVGQLVQGRITNLVDFGAFARLEPGVEGLIHISELAEGKIDHPSKVVKKGDEVTLRVLSVNVGRRRIGLSLRQAPPPEEPAEAEVELEPEPTPDDQAISAEVQEAVAEIAALEAEAVELAEVGGELEPEFVPDDQATSAEVQEAVVEIAALEAEAVELAEVEEELEPELAPDDQLAPTEVQEAVAEIVAPEEEAVELAEVEEELEPELAPDDQLAPAEAQEAVVEIAALEAEAVELAEVEVELELMPVPDDQMVLTEVQEPVEELAVPEEEAIEAGEEVPLAETDEETPQ